MTTATATRPLRRISVRAGDAALVVFGLLGAACIVLAVAAYAFGFQLVMFSTGSMSPTIPQGAAALTRTVSASDLKVGQIVTVHRDNGQLPITHRIISIDPVPGSVAQRSIRMRGDANEMPDAAPYVVETVDLVTWSMPGAARWITLLGRPPVMIGVLMFVGLLVLWSFWPKAQHDGAT